MTLLRLPQTLSEPVSLAAWIDRGIVAAVVLSCAVALSMNLADPDLWGHVQYGRDALAHGLPLTTTYSYVAEGYPWINHEIIAEYLLAMGADTFGGSGMLFVKCLLGLAVVTAILRRALQQGAGLIAACVLTLLVAVTLSSHWSLRPQLISYTSFTLLLALLSYAFDGWEGQWQLSFNGLRRLRFGNPFSASETPQRAFPATQLAEQPLTCSSARLRVLWLVPPLMIVWTNSHGGFLAGLCVYWAYLGLRSLEAISRKGRAADGLVLRLGLMGAAAGLATLVNPYGPRFHLWLFHDLRVPRPEIVEWRAPELFNLQFLPFWLLAAVASAALILTRRSRDFTHIVILGLVLWQALQHHRHIAFLAIAIGWWLPLHFDSLLIRLGIGHRFKSDEEQRFGWSPPEDSAFGAAFSPRMQQVFAILLVVAIGICGFQLIRRLGTLRVNRDTYPVGAIDYIARRNVNGKLVCTFNWAQYALAALGPRDGQPGTLVQIDGRCRTSYSQAMLDTHFDFILGNVGPDVRYRDPRSGPFDPARVLNVNRPDLVLISRRQEPSVQVMQSQQGRWTLLYQDGLAQVWGRASKYDDPASSHYVPRHQREIGDWPQTGWAHWPAIPPRNLNPDS